MTTISLVTSSADADDRGEGDVGGVTSGRDAHQAVDGRHPGGVEQVPLAVEVRLEEAVEVGRIEVDGVAGHVAGRDPEGAAES